MIGKRISAMNCFEMEYRTAVSSMDVTTTGFRSEYRNVTPKENPQ
jgi:hypothetical protein